MLTAHSTTSYCLKTRALNLLSGLVAKMLIKKKSSSLEIPDLSTPKPLMGDRPFWQHPSEILVARLSHKVRAWAALLANPYGLSDCRGGKQHVCSQNFSAKNILGLKIPSNLTDALPNIPQFPKYTKVHQTELSDLKYCYVFLTHLDLKATAFLLLHRIFC